MRLALTSQQEKVSVTASSKMRNAGNGLIFLCAGHGKGYCPIFRLDRFHSSMVRNADMIRAIVPVLHHELGMVSKRNTELRIPHKKVLTRKLFKRMEARGEAQQC